MCPHLCSSGAGSASPGAQGCELGSAHGWMVLIRGAALLNNTQKVLGWFHCNISRSAWYPEDTQLPVKGVVGMEKEQQAAEATCEALETVGKGCSGQAGIGSTVTSQPWP